MEGQTCVIVESLFQLKMHLGCLGPSKKYIFFLIFFRISIGNKYTNKFYLQLYLKKCL